MLVATQCRAMPTDPPHETGGESSPPLSAREALHDQGMLPEGSLIEISGPEASRQAAQILAKNTALPTAWIEHRLEAMPEEVIRARLNFDKILFIDGQRDSAWAASAILDSKLFPILVYRAPYENEKFLRRLRRQARESGASVLLLRSEPCFSWTIRVHLRAENGTLKVLRWRKQ